MGLNIKMGFRFFKRIYNSILCKNYKEMINQTSWYAIFYLAIFELAFTIIISTIVAKNFIGMSFMDIYQYANDFLVNFFDNSISLTFDTIFVLSIIGYLYQFLRKNKKKYATMFCLATYSSTLAMVLKYIIYICNYEQNKDIQYFKFIYIGIVVIYFLINYKKSIKN